MKKFSALNYLRDMSIRNKLILAFTVLILVPFVLFTSFYVYYVQNITKNKIVVAHKEITEKIGQNINMLLFNMQNAATLVISNNDVTNIISNNIHDDPENYFKNVKLINNFLTSLQYSVLRYPNSFIMVMDGYDNVHIAEGVCDYDTKKKIEEFILENIHEEENTDVKWVGIVKNEIKAVGAAPNIVTMIKKIPFNSGNKSNGSILVSISEENFYSVIKSSNIDSRIKIYLLDENDVVISSTNRTDVRSKFRKYDYMKVNPDGTVFADDKENKEVVGGYLLENGKWKVMQVIPYSVIYRDINKSLILFAVISFIFLILFILTAVIILGKITSPIINLTKAMGRVQSGDLDVSVDIMKKDEIGRLGFAFNEMIRRIKQLIKENNAKEKEKRTIELKMLRSQIKPHFLFNTLNSIRWVAEMNRARAVSDLIVALSALLRNSMLNDREFITLDEEIENLENYCKIQEVRYGGVFTLNYNIQGDAGRCKVINLLLQPIVENSLIHGFEAITSKGVINIDAVIKDNRLEIIVEDNGKGMSSDDIRDIFYNNQNMQGGIGIRNVNERLKMIYGNEYGIRMFGKIGVGVKTVIIIPVNFD